MVLKKDDTAGPAPVAPPWPSEGGTVRVKMRHQMSGTRDGADWPAPGEEIALPAEEAAALCGNGMAEPVDTRDEDVETAVAKKPATNRGQKKA